MKLKLLNQPNKIMSIWIIFIFSFGLFSQEVIYLEQNIEIGGMEMDQSSNSLTRSWIADNKVRIEQPGQAILLFFDEKKIITISLKEKNYIVMSFEEMDQILNLSNMLFQSTNNKEIFFEKTGKKEKINRWNAYQIKSKIETGSFELWLSEDVKIEREALSMMYKKMPGLSTIVSTLENSMKYPGFPVLTKAEMNVMGMEIEINIELVIAEQREIQADLFKIPADFNQIENPLKMQEE